MNKDEFFYACRHIALAQNDLKFEREILIRLNQKEMLPVFSDVHFQFKEKNFEDEDEFVSIEEDNAKPNDKNGKMSNNIITPQEIKEKAKITQGETILPTKKNIDDLFSLLDTLPATKGETKEVNHMNGDSINANLNPMNISTNGKIEDKNEDDEFVPIEEDNENQNNKPEPETTSNEQKLNEATKNVKEKKTEINFQDLIFNKNWDLSHKETEKENQSTKVNEINITNAESNEEKPKISLDDLLKTVPIEIPHPPVLSDVNKEESLRDHSANIIKTDAIIEDPKHNKEKENHNEKDQNEENANKKVQEIDGEEFCEVEEDHSHDNPSQPTSFPNEVATNIEESHKEIINSSKETKNEEPSKISIINYTPLDFLNEFAKENKATVNLNNPSDQEQKGGEFEFVVN